MSVVAVTGATSDFAAAILPLLLADDEVDRVVGLGRSAPRITHPKLTMVPLDMRDPSLAEVFAGCDTVIHLAFVVEEQRDKEASRDVNVRGSINVVESAHRAGVRRMVIASSASAYGSHDIPVPVTEDEFPTADPRRYYFADKAEVEHFVEWWLRRHPDEMAISLLRPTFVVGADVANSAIDMLTGPAIAFPHPRESRYQFMTQDDLASAFVLAAKRDLVGPFNIAPRDHTTAVELGALQGQFVAAVPRRLLRLGADSGYLLRLLPFSSHWISDGEAALDPDLFSRTTGWEPRAGSTECAAAMVLLRGRPIFGDAAVVPTGHAAEVTVEPATRRLRAWAASDPAIGELLGDDLDVLSAVDHRRLDTPVGGIHVELHRPRSAPLASVVIGVPRGLHARYLSPLAAALVRAGVAVALVDPSGHGLSTGRRGTRAGHDAALSAVADARLVDTAVTVVVAASRARGGGTLRALPGTDRLVGSRAGWRLPWMGRRMRGRGPSVTPVLTLDGTALRSGIGQADAAREILARVEAVTPALRAGASRG
ncbi:NAD-dependent epimerase/dehydratase family protein [uncultured Williamsia sp.]|uniref:NAD-dependent epimerase/dehydratase family protein n=1 Tax=uncultured Williamsia sp. TaxID=259311 RepID=UPI00260AB9C1|nr:NAD-dependent epimerase/dehydratase family protein [uncultured Williamsia sp.]